MPPNDSNGVRWWVEPRSIAGLSQRLVGEGAEAAALLWRAGGPPPREVVIFLHGWEARPPWTYQGWLRHLARRGNSIVYPVYQQPGEGPEDLLENALEGIGAGLRQLQADPKAVVAIGHNTGGALAFDYAAVAPGENLPAPRAVMAVYPGRRPPGGAIRSADLSQIPASTHLTVVSGPGNPIPSGDREARALLAGASQVPRSNRDFISAPYRRAPGPFPVSSEPRPSFWGPADRLIAAARAGTGN